jgi:hypothetical protein
MAWTSWFSWWLPGKQVQKSLLLASLQDMRHVEPPLAMTARTVDVDLHEAYLRACS